MFYDFSCSFCRRKKTLAHSRPHPCCRRRRPSNSLCSCCFPPPLPHPRRQGRPSSPTSSVPHLGSFSPTPGEHRTGRGSALVEGQRGSPAGRLRALEARQAEAGADPCGGMGAVAPSKASTAPSTRSPLSKISFLPMFLPLSKLALLLRKIPFGIGDEANRFRLIGATQTTGVGRCRRRAAFESHCGLSSRCQATFASRPTSGSLPT